MNRAWFDYKRGRISQAEAYTRLGKEFSTEPADIEVAFKQAQELLHLNEDLLALVRELKAQFHRQLRVFALSNISLPHYEFVCTLPTDWSIFNKVFASAVVGECKPALAIYEKVVAKTGPRAAVLHARALPQTAITRRRPPAILVSWDVSTYSPWATISQNPTCQW